MTRARSRFVIIFALLLIVGLIIWVVASFRHTVARNDWLVVSGVTFAARTNGIAVNQTVSFTISNQSPHGLRFSIPWFECRAKNSLTLLTNAYGQYSAIRLPGRGVVAFAIDIPAS